MTRVAGYPRDDAPPAIPNASGGSLKSKMKEMICQRR
jgi:hypothetical protein